MWLLGKIKCRAPTLQKHFWHQYWRPLSHSQPCLCRPLNKVPLLGLAAYIYICGIELYSLLWNVFYRSLSLNPACPAERGSNLARFHSSAETAGWSRTPNVANAALCHASPTWVPHQSKLGRCVITHFSLHMEVIHWTLIAVLAAYSLSTFVFQGVLADYVPDTSPMIPPIVVHCISEIEQRGLREVSVISLS